MYCFYFYSREKREEDFVYVSFSVPDTLYYLLIVVRKKKIFVSCLINNAELNPKMKDKKTKNVLNKIEDYTEKKIFREIEVGIMGTFNCCKVFGYEMSKKIKIWMNIVSDFFIVQTVYVQV